MDHRLLRRHGKQSRRVEPSLQRGPSHRVKAVDALCFQAGERLDPEQLLRRREGLEPATGEGEDLAVLRGCSPAKYLPTSVSPYC